MGGHSGLLDFQDFTGAIYLMERTRRHCVLNIYWDNEGGKRDIDIRITGQLNACYAS